MNFLRQTVFLALAVLQPVTSLYGVEILDADPELSVRLTTNRSRTEEHFGSEYFFRYQFYNHLLGSIYYEESREAVLVFGFRVTAEFLNEWKEQGQAHFLFNIIKFHEGDAHRICPILIQRLDAGATASEVAEKEPLQILGTISGNELKENHLYSFRVDYRENLNPGDTVWIGLDATNPMEPKNHNLIIAGDLNAYPGGSPPILIAGSPEAESRTVHGISLLQSLNRLFYAPANLEEVQHRETVVPRWINPLRTTRKLNTLEGFHETLRQELSKLPESPVRTPERYKGFHSSVKPRDEEWELRFPVSRRVTSIALYPALCQNGLQTEVYAFPKRFIITAFPRGDGEPVVVADWSQTDFPQTGVSPVIFPFAWKSYREIRMRVIEGADMPGGHAFALSEVSFPRRYNTWPINMETPDEDSLETPPFWSKAYATDGRTAFGNPTATTAYESGSFKTLAMDSKPIQITIQHKKKTMWNSFEFHPTQNPNDLPPDGFPARIRIEFSNEDDFSEIIHTEQTTITESVSDAAFPYFLRFPIIYAQFVRITLLPSSQAPPEQMLELEEITFNGGLPLVMRGWYFDHNTISGSPGTAALYDRIINGNQLDPPVRRSSNLIRRDILLDELRQVESTMLAVKKANADTISGLKAGGIILTVTLTLLIILYQRRLSKKVQHRIRHRIQQDLHDEIGSQLSTISMISNFNRKATHLDPELRTELTDINQSAREAIASLAEVIWLTDKEILTLDQCFDVMKKRAQKMVHAINLELSFPQKAPALKLSYRTKRNLLLLFTEALNNALKHSGADTIQVSARISEGKQLVLMVVDNGQGFEKDSSHGGIGLESMYERAQKLGGILDIISSPNQGTRVTFRGKL